MERIRSNAASRLALAFVLAAAVAVLVAPAVASAAVTISGTLQDTAHSPVSGIMVQLYAAHAGYVTDARSLDDGTFSVVSSDAWGDGDYWLMFDDGTQRRFSTVWYGGALERYFNPHPADITVSGGSASIGTYELLRGVTIHVDVKRPGGEAVEKTTVQAWRTTPESGMSVWSAGDAVTDSSGECTLTNMPPGEYYVEAQDAHHVVPDNWFKWYTRGRYPIDSSSPIGEGASVAWSVETSMLPQATVGVVGLSDTSTWMQSPTGIVSLDLGLDSDFGAWDPKLLYCVYPEGGTPPPPSWPMWDGSSQPTIAVTEGRYTLEAYGQLNHTVGLDPDEDGNGPEVTRTLGIDNTPPHTTANVGTVSQPTLELKAVDPLSGVGLSEYRLDSVDTVPVCYLGPVLLTRGVHSVMWRSVDAASNGEEWHSGTIISGPQANVSRPKGSSKTRVRRTLSFSGKLTRAANHRRLTLLAYRFNGTDWVLARTKVVTTHTPRRRGMTTYRGSIKFTAKGSWKVIARYEGDGYWVQSYSAPKYVIVR
jgi:hypothetical protein